MSEPKPKPNATAAAAQAKTTHRLLRKFKKTQDAPLWRPLARWALLAALRDLNGAPPPGFDSTDVEKLAEVVAAAAAETATTMETVESSLVSKFDHYVKSISLIRVDMLFRYTVPANMPANHKHALLVLAGHSDGQQRCWPARLTLAGEVGVSVDTMDSILSDLVARRWITKKTRRGSNGKTLLSNFYVVHPECGEWWTMADRMKRHRLPPRDHAEVVVVG